MFKCSLGAPPKTFDIQSVSSRGDQDCILGTRKKGL